MREDKFGMKRFKENFAGQSVTQSPSKSTGPPLTGSLGEEALSSQNFLAQPLPPQVIGQASHNAYLIEANAFPVIKAE